MSALIAAALLGRVYAESSGSARRNAYSKLKRQIYLYDTSTSLNLQNAEYFIPEFALDSQSFRLHESQRIQAISYACEVARSILEPFSGEEKPGEVTKTDSKVMPKSWFPNVVGIFVKGKFIDFSSTKGERLYIRYGPMAD